MNIHAPKALWLGIGRVLRNWRLWVLFYFMNLLFAGVIALPFATVFSRDISRSLVGSELLKGFNFRWYVEFVHANGVYFDSLVPQVVFLFALYLLMEVFLAGGFYTAFSVRGRMRLSSFFENSASQFFPLLLVMLAQIVLLILLYEGNSLWASANRIVASKTLSDGVILRAEVWRYAAVIAAFMIINLFADFTRAAIAIDTGGLLNKVRRGFYFALRHPLSSAGVYLGGTVISAAVISAFFLTGPGTKAADENGVILEIAVGQFFILLRIFSKLIFYAGEAALYKENQIEIINVKPEMLE